MPTLFLTLAVIGISFTVQLPKAHASENPCPFVWSQNLKLGSAGNDTLRLQQFLNTNLDTLIASDKAGSPGNETSTYGTLTVQAIVKFQEKYASEILSPVGLVSGTGFVGTRTRAKLNALCTTRSVPTISTVASSTDALTLSSPTQPAWTILPAGAGGVPFTSVTLSAGNKDVTVKSIVVKRVGVGSDSAFDSIALIDENGNQLGDEKGLRADHTATLGEPYVIPAYTSKTFTVVANMAEDLSGNAGEMPVLQIEKINTSTKVLGQLPVRGTAHTANATLLIGGATAALSPFDPGGNRNRSIGDTKIRFSGIRLTASSAEDITLSSITWNQAGSVSVGDVAHVTTVIHDIPYRTEIDGRKFTSTFLGGIVIQKGETVDIQIIGDITLSGANRTIKFDLEGSDDIVLTGKSYGFGVGITASNHTAVSGNSVFITSDGTKDGKSGTPFFSGSVISIKGATINSIGRN